MCIKVHQVHVASAPRGEHIDAQRRAQLHRQPLPCQAHAARLVHERGVRQLLVQAQPLHPSRPEHRQIQFDHVSWPYIHITASVCKTSSTFSISRKFHAEEIVHAGAPKRLQTGRSRLAHDAGGPASRPSLSRCACCKKKKKKKTNDFTSNLNTL